MNLVIYPYGNIIEIMEIQATIITTL